MRLLLDADAIIKLNRAGVLAVVVNRHECVVPRAVYEEAVSAGRAHGYPDATEIEEILMAGAHLLADRTEVAEKSSLGFGEQAILAAFNAYQGSSVVSDDHRFLTELEALSIPSLTPPDVLVLLAGNSDIPVDEARAALDRMRASIREDAYVEGIDQLNNLAGGHE